MQKIAESLKGPFNLAINRKSEIQYYKMKTQFIHMNFDGKRRGTETYLLKLKCNPAALTGKKFDQCTCKEFGLQINDNTLTAIPKLDNWEYEFNPMSGLDGGPVFGIPHDVFNDLKDKNGNKLSPDIRYAIYNNFVDFHALNDAFSRPMFGKGVDALKFIGDKIVHPAAFSEAPVNLGTTVKPGSVFHNGEITLELKGVSVVDGNACALVGYDSGESTLKMKMESGNRDKLTEGGSEYIGNIYIDLKTGFVRKITLDEFVITEVTEGESKEKNYTVRHLSMDLIDKKDFEKENF